MEIKLDIPSEHINFDQYERKIKYSIESIENVRKQLICDLYKESSRSRCELNLKRKIGVLTDEMVNYYLYGKKPNELNEDENYFENWSKKICLLDKNNLNNSISHLSTVYEIDIDDLVQPLGETSKIVVTDLTKEKKTIEIDKQDANHLQNILTPEHSQTPSSISTSSSYSSLYKMVDPIREENEIKMLNNELNLSHGCSKKCLKYIPMIKDESLHLNHQLMFICDYCLFKTKLNDRIIQHMDSYEHNSASEYYIESFSSNSNNESTSNEINTNFVIKYLKARSSKIIQKKDFQKKIENHGIFCPKCHLFFEQNIIACALHYKFSHRLNELIYSTSNLVKVVNFDIGKSHKCLQQKCNMKFKKLTDLIAHLEIKKHFPISTPNEINIFHCPFDDCKFKSNAFFTFKTHLMTHSFFNRQTNEHEDPLVTVKVFIYNIPNSYFHLNLFDETIKSEKHAELNGLNYLLENTKNQAAFIEINKKIKARKDQILTDL
jgi:hypothetical protein